jgi:hypothetical protein
MASSNSNSSTIKSFGHIFEKILMHAISVYSLHIYVCLILYDQIDIVRNNESVVNTNSIFRTTKPLLGLAY